jgi:hypothetical protein
MAASRNARGQKARKANERQSELLLENAADPELGPCPRCGKREGEIHEADAGRFRYFTLCRACSWSTDHARLKSVAVKLWNEAKLAHVRRPRGGAG